MGCPTPALEVQRSRKCSKFPKIDPFGRYLGVHRKIFGVQCPHLRPHGSNPTHIFIYMNISDMAFVEAAFLASRFGEKTNRKLAKIVDLRRT